MPSPGRPSAWSRWWCSAFPALAGEAPPPPPRVSAPRLEIRLDRIHHNAATLVARLAPGHRRHRGHQGHARLARSGPGPPRRRRRRPRRVADRERRAATAAGIDARIMLIRSPMLEPGRPGGRRRRRQPQQRAGGDQGARPPPPSHGADPRRRPDGRAGRPAGGHPPRRRGRVRPPDARASPASRCGASAPTWPARAAPAPTPPTWPSSSDLATKLEATLRHRPRRRVGRKLGQPRLGARRRVRRRADQRPPPGRIDPARLRAAPPPTRSTGCTPTPSPSSPRSSSPRRKPSVAWGTRRPDRVRRRRRRPRTRAPTTGGPLVALGRQDVDPDGLTPPAGIEVLGASSDHLVLDAGDAAVAVGTELRFGVDYSALLRAATSTPWTSSPSSSRSQPEQDRDRTPSGDDRCRIRPRWWIPATPAGGAKRTKAWSCDQAFFRGAKGNRTPDLFHAMEALYQLSYSPEGAVHLSKRSRLLRIRIRA